MEELENAYELGLRGDVDAIDRALATLGDDPSELAIAWRAALDGLRWFAVPCSPERADEIAAAIAPLVGAGPAARNIGARACAHLVRARALAFDADRMSSSIALSAELARGLEAEEAGAWHRVTSAWAALAAGRAADHELESAAKHGLRARRADLLLEASALRALIEATTAEAIQPDADGDPERLENAIALARRVSRMARTEALPQLEYLAHLALARVRRISGKPHLATRILTALLRVATPPWRPWLGWEMIHAHGTTGALDDLPGSRAPRLLLEMLDRARAGDRSHFARAAIECRHLVGRFAPHALDLESACVALDFAAAPITHRGFWAGEIDEPPRGQTGLSGIEAARDEPIAWVFAPTDAASRRLLAPGLGLAKARAAMLDGAESEGPQLRTDSAIAALALAGQSGIDENALFKRLYGFSYEPERHQAVRGVLYGRVRQRLGTVATLERESGRLSLRHARPLLVPDPRSTPPAELRILQVLAEHRQAAPKDVASALGIPLRTAQDALRRLTDDGAVKREKAARGLHYILEDTTFSEPTKTTVLE
jgi:hypothetical protein